MIMTFEKCDLKEVMVDFDPRSVKLTLEQRNDVEGEGRGHWTKSKRLILWSKAERAKLQPKRSVVA